MCSQEEIKAIKGVLSPPQEKIIKAHLIDIKQGENGPELILYVGREERTLPFPMLIHPFEYEKHDFSGIAVMHSVLVWLDRVFLSLFYTYHSP